MTQITLEAIKAEHTRLAELIAQFEAQPASECEQIHFPEVLIDLSHGEHYAGLIVGKDGEPSYHLVLLPGEAEKVTFAEAKEWAGLQGYMSKASLPTRREQALLYANLKEQFQPAWYCGLARSALPRPAGPGVRASTTATSATAASTASSAPGPSAD